MRRVFIRNLGVAPLDYRKSFRSAYADGGRTMPPAPRASEIATPQPRRRGERRALERAH
jgi:hypothetical protein